MDILYLATFGLSYRLEKNLAVLCKNFYKCQCRRQHKTAMPLGEQASKQSSRKISKSLIHFFKLFKKFGVSKCQNIKSLKVSNIKVVKYQSDQNLEKSKCIISNFQNFKAQKSSAKQREAKQSKIKQSEAIVSWSKS